MAENTFNNNSVDKVIPTKKTPKKKESPKEKVESNPPNRETIDEHLKELLRVQQALHGAEQHLWRQIEVAGDLRGPGTPYVDAQTYQHALAGLRQCRQGLATVYRALEAVESTWETMRP